MGVVWLVLLDGGIGCIGSWEGSTWALMKLNEFIVVKDRVKISINSIGRWIKFLFIVYINDIYIIYNNKWVKMI